MTIAVDCKNEPLINKLLPYLGHISNGFYIEAGANDGIFQSSTLYLQHYLGWTGLLVEPSKSCYDRLPINRPGNIYEHTCLVSSAYNGTNIKGDFDGHPMSSVHGQRLSRPTQEHVVPAHTLSSILYKHGVEHIDFFSLDTEGYELEVLKGLDLNKHRPTYMMIEIYTTDYEKIVDYLHAHDYKMIESLTNFNHTDNPIWDGTHNDYLFVDMKNCPQY